MRGFANTKDPDEMSSYDTALEGVSGIQVYLPKTLRDAGHFCKYLKGYGILGSILGIWGYNAF